MYNLDVYNALTEALSNHKSDVEYARDVVRALEEKLEQAKIDLENEQNVHKQLNRVRKLFSPNAIDRIVAQGQLYEGAVEAEEDTEGSLAVLKVLNVVE